MGHERLALATGAALCAVKIAIHERESTCGCVDEFAETVVDALAEVVADDPQ